jgi:hypothetical protein
MYIKIGHRFLSTCLPLWITYNHVSDEEINSIQGYSLEAKRRSLCQEITHLLQKNHWTYPKPDESSPQPHNLIL